MTVKTAENRDGGTVTAEDREVTTAVTAEEESEKVAMLRIAEKQT